MLRFLNNGKLITRSVSLRPKMSHTDVNLNHSCPFVVNFSVFIGVDLWLNTLRESAVRLDSVGPLKLWLPADP